LATVSAKTATQVNESKVLDKVLKAAELTAV